MKDTGLLNRYYSSPGSQDVRRYRDSMGRDNFRNTNPERETLKQRMNAFANQARKSSSSRRFEPCYRQIYPSKKRKATFTIPKKPPYIPAVYQTKTSSYKDKYAKINLEPVKGRRLQWPPLYPSKRDYQRRKQSASKGQELPPWLLPLYSCKACRTMEDASTSEARFSGGAFHRKMEMMESIKHIQNQGILLSRVPAKGPTKEETARYNAVKSANAVESLKRKIDSMQDYLSTVKKMEDYRKKYQTQNKLQDSEVVEEPAPVRQPYARLYQTKPPTLEREVRVRKSIGLGVSGSKPPDKPFPGAPTNNVDQQVEKAKDMVNTKTVHTPKKQYDESVAKNSEVEVISSKQPLGSTYQTAEANYLYPIGEILKESVVMIKQPSWKKIMNNHKTNDSITDEMKSFNKQTINESIPNNDRASPKKSKSEVNNDLFTMNQQLKNIKIQECKAAEETKTPDSWTVESLKSRINVMKIKSSLDQPEMKKAEDMSLTRNGGEIGPKISQVALRSFHKDAGSKLPRKLQMGNTIKVQLGYPKSMGKRNYSTFRPSSVRPASRALVTCRRTIGSTPQSKKRNWVSRLKRCFVIKKVKGPKCENWKDAPREIPYGSEEVKHVSPAPMLWKRFHSDEMEIHKQSNPPEVMLKEKVNPAVLNAEQRVLASIGRLVSTESQPEAPDVRINDVEKKIKRAKHKVNLGPWFKRSKHAENEQNLPQLSGFSNSLDKEEPHESGYEWILKNRDTVEELKRQSRYAAGKPLVPTEVKNAINKYKVPLKVEISRYRQKMERKCAETCYLGSTTKRWYSTGFTGKHNRLLPSSDVILLNSRSIKTDVVKMEHVTPSKFLVRRPHFDIALGRTLRGYNQRVSHKKQKEVEESCGNPVEETRPKKWAWKIPTKTRAFTPKSTSLTSPSKMMSSRMSEMSPCALKKQVEELKRLIKKARQEVADKAEETATDTQSNGNYEARLKRLVIAAHNNAQKMQIKEPVYSSENNMFPDKPGTGKQRRRQPMVQYKTKQVEDVKKQKAEVSVLKSLFRKTKSNSLADEILNRNKLSSLPGRASKKKTEKHVSRVYLKLKSVLEAVRKKSAMLDPITDVKVLPNKSLKGSSRMDAGLLPISSETKKSFKLADTAKAESIDKETSPARVELLAQRTPAPSNTIQLWNPPRENPQTREFNHVGDKEPSYGDLLSLFSKARGLFYDPPTEDTRVADQRCQFTETNKASNYGQNMVTENEISKNWLNIREEVSNAARAVSEQRNCSLNVTEPLLQTKPGGHHFSDCIMTKSEMIPAELLKLGPKNTVDHMWSSIPVKVSDDEDLCRKSTVQQKFTNEESRLAELPVEKVIPPTLEEIGKKTTNASIIQINSKLSGSKTVQQETTNLASFEPAKSLFQKPMLALESITKNLGLFGKQSESYNRADSGNSFERINSINSKSQTAGVSDPLREESNPKHVEMSSRDNGIQCSSAPVGAIASNSLPESGNTQEVTPHQRTVLCNPRSEQGHDWHQANNDQYVQDCTKNMKPLEEMVKKYEDYYRNYFAKDILSGYEQLQEVYEGLNKLKTVPQYECSEVPSNFGLKPEKVALTQPSPIVQDEMNISSGVMTNYNSHRPGEIPSNGQTDAGNTQLSDSHNQHATMTSGYQVAGNFRGEDTTMISQNFQNSTNQVGIEKCSEQKESHNFQQSESDYYQIQPVDAMRNSESSIDPTRNIHETIHIHESQPGLSANMDSNALESKERQAQFSGNEDPVNFQELLTKDPSLNPEVVKNLKLPVVLSEDCRTEKNWYTKFQTGNHQNR